ncbi:MAG TPA: PAS domain S-box protein [Pyrinomonadaceae bacterium]
MKGSSTKRERGGPALAPLKIAGAYLLFGCLWILFSDELLSALITNKDLLTRWQTLKGWGFTFITALMLYVMISRSMEASRKLNAERLESEARLRRVVESNMIGIVFWDARGRVIDANDAFLRIVGYTREELLEGKVKWQEMTPPEHRRLDNNASEERRAFGNSAPYEKEYIRKGGRRIQVLIGVATLNETDDVRIAFVLDITERKRVEQALRESERQLRKVLENIPLVSVMFDQEGRIIFCNNYLLKLTGWGARQVVGKNWFETFVPPEQRELIKYAFTEMLKRGVSPPHIEYQISGRDRERRIISWSNTALLGPKGEVIGTMGIGEDVTERKQSEEKLLNSYEQLRALSAHLQSVREEERIRIAREIHDVLGQALTGLKMDVWWLVKKLSDPVSSVERSVLLEKLESMSKLINGTIPSVRKLATELRPGVLDDLGLIAAIEWQTKEFQARTGIICRCSLPAEDIDLGPDRSTAVFRIFQEVLTNIARHAHANRVEINMNVRDADLVLEVKDNGKGITENEVSGVGSLGLLGMRERALLFGGEVKIGPARDTGTVVNVRIPLHLKRPVSAAGQSRAQGVR